MTMSGFETTNNFENIDPADFGEPTPETRARFENVLDSLKSLVPAITYNPDVILTAYGFEDTPESILDNLCPLTSYTYDQAVDPLFGIGENTHLDFGLLDSDEEKFNNWAQIFGDDVAIQVIHYINAELSMSYGRSFTQEGIHITNLLTTNTSIMADDFSDVFMQAMEEQEEAFESGAITPTEGSMRRLVDALEEEIAKRITEN